MKIVGIILELCNYMKRLIIILLLASAATSNAQVHTFVAGSGEMIFSFAKIKDAGIDKSSELRWAPVFNGQGLVNHDFGNNFGLFYGLAYRNVGFIYEPTPGLLKKYRNYNLGIPIGIKIGNLSKYFIFGGYELEIPYSYKEKTFVNYKSIFDEGTKTVETEWFSPKVNPIVQSVFVGVNFKGGMSVKLKYYLDPFFNKNYTTKDASGNTIKPYQNFDVNVFYVSLSMNVFKDVKAYKKKFKKHKKEVETSL